MAVIRADDNRAVSGDGRRGADLVASLETPEHLARGVDLAGAFESLPDGGNLLAIDGNVGLHNPARSHHLTTRNYEIVHDQCPPATSKAASRTSTA